MVIEITPAQIDQGSNSLSESKIGSIALIIVEDYRREAIDSAVRAMDIYPAPVIAQFLFAAQHVMDVISA